MANPFQWTLAWHRHHTTALAALFVFPVRTQLLLFKTRLDVVGKQNFSIILSFSFLNYFIRHVIIKSIWLFNPYKPNSLLMRNWPRNRLSSFWFSWDWWNWYKWLELMKSIDEMDTNDGFPASKLISPSFFTPWCHIGRLSRNNLGYGWCDKILIMMGRRNNLVNLQNFFLAIFP